MDLAFLRVLDSISVDSKDQLLISFVQVMPYKKLNIEMKLSTIHVYFSQILGVEGMQGLGHQFKSPICSPFTHSLILIFPSLTPHCALRIKACYGASL